MNLFEFKQEVAVVLDLPTLANLWIGGMMLLFRT